MKKLFADCIVVAAGKGTRLGAGIPKAFVRLGGVPLFAHSLRRFAAHPAVGRIILVVSPTLVSRAQRIVRGLKLKKDVTIIRGGTHRWQSVKNGVAASSAAWVLVHDSARPFVANAVIDSVLLLSKKYRAVISAVPEVDTVRRFSGDRALETVDRSELVRVQTPQLFLRTALVSAFNHAETLAQPPTDEAMLMEAGGVNVGIAEGDPLNFKITTPADLTLARALWKAKRPA